MSPKIHQVLLTTDHAIPFPHAQKSSQIFAVFSQSTNIAKKNIVQIQDFLQGGTKTKQTEKAGPSHPRLVSQVCIWAMYMSQSRRYNLRKKIRPSTYFWCLSLLQMEDSIQYLKGPNDIWKDHNRNIFCPDGPQYACHGPSRYRLVISGTQQRPLLVTSSSSSSSSCVYIPPIVQANLQWS